MRRTFTILAALSLAGFIVYWAAIARWWIGLQPWRPDVMLTGAWYFEFLLPLPLAIVPVWWVIEKIAEHRRHRRAEAGRCVRCGYDLRATPERCPECGHVPAQVQSPAV